MRLDNNQQAFFALVKAGLWEREVRLSEYEDIDFSEVYRLAEEQSVIGLVVAGLEHVTDIKIPKSILLTFIGNTLQQEQRNQAMNEFVAKIITSLREEGIYTLLVKGQGLAQCYERPLWRTSGDVDLLLSDDNYEKAKKLLIPIATNVETEYTHFKHQGMTIDGWMVELHGTQHSRLSRRVDNMIDSVQADVFPGGEVRTWQNDQTPVFLPSPDNDVIFVFTHILHHFFFEGIGLRQLCDWCRLLCTYKDTIRVKRLEDRLKRAGIMSEWKAFAAFAVEYLGMPMEAMPLYPEDACWKKKAARIRSFVLEVGNFGHNQRRDYSGQPYLARKFNSFWGRLHDMLRHFSIFPKDSIVFFGGVLRSGVHAVVRGE